MKIKNVSYAKIFNYVCVVLMLLLLVTQFLPFWSCGGCEDGMASVSDYLWFPERHKDITKGIMRDLYGKKFDVMQIVLAPLIIFVGCVLGIFLSIKNAGSPLAAIVCLITGGAGVIGYLTTAGLQLGQNWILHVIASALVMVCALVSLSEPIIKLVKKNAKKE